MGNHDGGADRAPARPGWWRSLIGVLGASVLVGVGCLLVLLGLGALHLVPVGQDAPGSGWPWRLDGAWAALADAGPVLALSFAFAATTSGYLRDQTGVKSIRWPLALVAAIVGWLPLAGGRHGLLVVSGGGALAAVVIAARWWSIVPRRPLPWSRTLVAGFAIAAVALAAASVSYGALHPLGIPDDGAMTATLRHGRSERLRLDVENRGPLAARVQRVATVDDDPQLGLPVRIARAELDSGKNIAPTPAGLFKPLHPQRVAPGDSVPVYLTLTVAACRRPGTTVDLRVRELDVGLRVAGRDRTQRVRLQHALRVRCDTAG